MAAIPEFSDSTATCTTNTLNGTSHEFLIFDEFTNPNFIERITREIKKGIKTNNGGLNSKRLWHWTMKRIDYTGLDHQCLHRWRPRNWMSMAQRRKQKRTSYFRGA